MGSKGRCVVADGGYRIAGRGVVQVFADVACDAPTERMEACNTHVCPIDCGVAYWTAWGECSASCGRGERARSRLVHSPQEGTGKVCPQLQVCASRADEAPKRARVFSSAVLQDKVDCSADCRVDCTFTSWAAWGACSGSCATAAALQARVRLNSAASFTPRMVRHSITACLSPMPSNLSVHPR